MFPTNNVIFSEDDLVNKVSMYIDSIPNEIDWDFPDEAQPSLDDREAIFGSLSEMGVDLNYTNEDDQAFSDKLNSVSRLCTEVFGNASSVLTIYLIGNFTPTECWIGCYRDGQIFKSSQSIEGIHFSDEKIFNHVKTAFYSKLSLLKDLRETLLEFGVITINEV